MITVNAINPRNEDHGEVEILTKYRVAPRRVAAETDDVRMIGSYNDQCIRRVSHRNGALDRFVKSDDLFESQLGRSFVMTLIDTTACHTCQL